MIYTYGQTIRNVEEYGAVYAGYYIVDVDCFAGCVPDDPVHLRRMPEMEVEEEEEEQEEEEEEKREDEREKGGASEAAHVCLVQGLPHLTGHSGQSEEPKLLADDGNNTYMFKEDTVIPWKSLRGAIQHSQEPPRGAGQHQSAEAAHH